MPEIAHKLSAASKAAVTFLQIAALPLITSPFLGKLRKRLPELKINLHPPLPKHGAGQMQVEIVKCPLGEYHVLHYYEATCLMSELNARRFGSLYIARELKKEFKLWRTARQLNIHVALCLARDKPAPFIDKQSNQLGTVRLTYNHYGETDWLLKKLGRPSVYAMHQAIKGKPLAS